VRIVLDEEGALVEYYADFLDGQERRALRAELEGAQASFAPDRVTLYGRSFASPRLVCAFGDAGLIYRYSGVERPTQPWLPSLLALRDRLAALAAHPFNYALANWYRNGDDYMGWHSDKEADLAPQASIASISLGAERPFLLRDRRGKGARTIEVTLGDGSLLWMKGETQQRWKHSLPRRRALSEPRLNLTFRQILRPQERG
jgi:alkylated DNA repair dioxygenase AlkB